MNTKGYEREREIEERARKLYSNKDSMLQITPE